VRTYAYRPANHVHSTLEAIIESAFAATAGQDLSFDNEGWGTKGLGDGVRLIWGVGDDALWRGYAILYSVTR
jgi:hypothetical protein